MIVSQWFAMRKFLRDIYSMCFLRMQPQIKSRVRKASIPRLSRNAIEKLKFPGTSSGGTKWKLVRILDNFTELTDELTAKLTAELTARQKQYGFYRDKLLSFSENEVEYLPLGKLYPDIRNGFVGTVTPFFSNKEGWRIVP